MKKLSTMFALILAAALAGQFAQAVATGTGGGKKALFRTMDANNYPLAIDDDKAWKVFEVFNTATAAQIVDENGVAPKQGMIKKVCRETGTTGSAHLEYVLLWDTITAADMALATSGRRLAPPLPRATLTVECTDLNALFTAGAGVKNSSAVGSTYVYWRELGGSR